MTDEQKLLQQQKLAALSPQDWKDAVNETVRCITKRLRASRVTLDNGTQELVGGLTDYGPHSEHHLGENALQYYVSNAIKKLYEGDWEWQERFSLGEQLSRVALRLIQNENEKYREVFIRAPEQPETDPTFMDAVRKYGQYMKRRDLTEVDQAYQKLLAAAKGDTELEAFVNAISECAPFAIDNDNPSRVLMIVRQHMDISPRQCYNLMKRLKRKVNNLK